MEIEKLKNALSELTEEKEALQVLYAECLEKSYKLELDLSSAQSDVQRLTTELLNSTKKLKTVEEICVRLESSNKSLKTEASDLAKRIMLKDQELSDKHDGMEEHTHYVQVEAALETLLMLHTGSQEEQRNLALELKNGLQMVKDLEIANWLHYNEGAAGCTPHTCVNMSISNTSISEPLMLDQLELGVTATIVVMICRMWGVNSATGRYLSTDFIVSDEKGNLMHCTARGNVAHNFLLLKEGAIYSLKNFTVQPNKDDFRVLRFAHFIVEIDGDIVVCKSSVRPDGFARYPFQLVEFDSLEPTNNKYLIGKALNGFIN
ncbi:protein NETWORKED 1A [Tanacetum coccineum]